MISDYCKNIANIVAQNYKNREVVVWGDKNTAFEQYLKDEYGIAIAFHSFFKKELCDGVNTKPMSCLKNNKDKYYVINLQESPIEKNITFFEENGYEMPQDYILAGAKETRVPKGIFSFTDN